MKLSGDVMLYKNTLKKIKKSLGRYLSLFLIIFVGVGFYSGIRAFAPNMFKQADNYYKEHNLMDFKVVSSMGLTDNDIEVIRSIDGVKEVNPSYSVDVLTSEKSIRVHSISDINKFELVDGRMPEDSNECLADVSRYGVGDTIVVSSNVSGILVSSEFKVVGTIKSVLYVSDDYGNSQVGDGKLNSFIFVNADSFSMEAYSEIYITIKADYTSYTDEYLLAVSKVKTDLNLIKKDREDARCFEIKEQVRREIIDSNPGIENMPEVLNEMIDKAEIEEVKWYIFDREIVRGYPQLELDVKVVEKVADILPIFFIVIVILMTTNTMNRMIVEERGEMGTLSSLGYKNSSIINTYLLYVISATLIGVMLGYFVGSYALTTIIYGVFPYSFPPIVVEYSVLSVLVIFLVAFVIMGLVVLYSSFNELKDRPAKLFRPIPPKSGQKIVLEHIKFIWKRTSFTWKITFRNMFRYKKRVFMTILGIACCTGLLLVGFGLKDSINGIGDIQFNEIFKYDSMIILTNEVDSLNDELKSSLEKESFNIPLLINQSSYEAINNDNNIDTYLVLVSDEKLFGEYYNFKSIESAKKVSLNSDGAVITNKLAKLLDIKLGDKVIISSSNGEKISIIVSDIVENYVMNYIFINSDVYSDVYSDVINEEITYNIALTSFDGDKKVASTNLIKDNIAVSVDFSSDLVEKSNNAVGGLDSIVLLIIVISAALSFIVLYNLTSINISERTREVATIKVLGFTDVETNEYIYRETLILTLIGIVVGLGLGILLHSFVIGITEVETMSYFKSIKFWSFVWAVLISFGFSLIIQVITYFKLKKVDMIESLKSVE